VTFQSDFKAFLIEKHSHSFSLTYYNKCIRNFFSAVNIQIVVSVLVGCVRGAVIRSNDMQLVSRNGWVVVGSR